MAQKIPTISFRTYFDSESRCGEKGGCSEDIIDTYREMLSDYSKSLRLINYGTR